MNDFALKRLKKIHHKVVEILFQRNYNIKIFYLGVARNSTKRKISNHKFLKSIPKLIIQTKFNQNYIKNHLLNHRVIILLYIKNLKK